MRVWRPEDDYSDMPAEMQRYRLGFELPMPYTIMELSGDRYLVVDPSDGMIYLRYPAGAIRHREVILVAGVMDARVLVDALTLSLNGRT